MGNTNNKKGATGILDQGKFVTISEIDNFENGWTHIAPVPHYIPENAVLFYNSLNGSGALNFSPTVRAYANGAFTTGWTHIISDLSGILFYNAISGEGAIAIPIFIPKIFTGSNFSPLCLDDISTVKYYKSGEFSTDWTHIESSSFGIIFYNAENGSGAIGRLVPRTARPNDARDFETDVIYPSGYFDKQWSNLVAVENNIFFYNRNTGEAVLMEKADEIKIIKRWPVNAFSQGWTHILATVDTATVRPK